MPLLFLPRRRRTGLFFLACAVLAFASVVCRPAPEPPHPFEARFQAELDSLRMQYGFPGATAAAILPDGTIVVAATGLADVEQKIPMTPRSRMLAASIGKTFVAATALALARDSVLILDEPISRWLGKRPWFSRLPNHETLTLRRLLTHTSGVPDHVESERFIRAFRDNRLSSSNPFPPEKLIEFILDQPALFPAGEGWAYSDTGYILVGLIIEAATGHTYYEEVGRRFLNPLGLILTSPSDRFELPGLASGYMAADNMFGLPGKTTVRPGVMAWHPGIEWTGGGLVSNPGDLVKWAQALYNGLAMTGPYVETLLQSVPVSPDTPDIRYGLGVAIRVKGPLGPTYGHSGWIPGTSSSLRFYADYDMAVAFQINTDIGVIDHSTPVVEDMETRLARVVASAVRK